MARNQNRFITDWDDVPVIMDLAYASRIVGLCVATLKLRAQKGTFPAYKEGVEWRVEKQALRDHIAANRNSYSAAG